LFRSYDDDNPIPESRRREYSIEMIQALIERRGEYLEESVCWYNNFLHDFIKNRFGIKIGAKISSGKFKAFADQRTCRELVQGLRIVDDISPVRTIHKAKGCEFENVLVVFESEDELKHILESDTEADDDDCRIYYVAFSRAESRLIVTVPGLGSDSRVSMESLGMSLVDV